MRKLLLFLLFTQLAFGQDRIVYLDSSFVRAEKGSHVYSRVIKNYDKEQSSFEMRIYYKSGVLKEEGVSLNRDYPKYDGQVLSYYDNTQIEKIEMYRNGKRAGNYKKWYPNGDKELEGYYTNDGTNEVLHITKFWDANKTMTVIDANGIYDYATPKFTEKGPIKNGLRDGEWKGTYVRMGYSFVETYDSGAFKGGEGTTLNGEKLKYTEVVTNPQPKRGLEKFYNYVAGEFRNPTDQTGKIMLSFYVTENGDIENVTIYRGISETLNAEAKRVLLKSGKWIPGKKRGLAVGATYMLPILLQSGR